MEKTMILNGKIFTIKKTIASDKKYKGDYYTLNECYKQPSCTKTSIYNAWLDFIYNLENTSIHNFGISSYNSNMFSLRAFITLDNKDYEIYITRTKQEIRGIA